MKLELGTFIIKDVQISSRTAYEDGVIIIDVHEVRRLILEDGHFAEVSIHVVRPGDQKRLIHVVDVVEPRYKPDGGSTFPGFYGHLQTVGAGSTHQLTGMAVVTTSEPVAGDPIYDTEAIIDMAGPAADLTPFSRTINLVLDLKPHPKFLRTDTPDSKLSSIIGGSPLGQAYRRQIRTVELKVAAYLAQATSGAPPEYVRTYELVRPERCLPRVAYLLHNIPWIYGERIPRTLPTLLHPNELLDGALVSVRRLEACSRDATYFFQNPSIVSELYRRHGVDLDFVGVVLFTGGPDMNSKMLSSEHAYKLLEMLRVQGVCASSSTSGNPWVEFMTFCSRCEQGGIKTVLVMPEEIGDPEDHGFSHYVPEAISIVSTGRGTQEIRLPVVEQVIGGDNLFQKNGPAAGPLTVPYTYIFGASTNIGSSWLTAREY